jgi:hypothetical protein
MAQTGNAESAIRRKTNGDVTGSGSHSERAMKNAGFWDVVPCGSCESRRFGGTFRLHHQGETNQRATNSVNSNYLVTTGYC